MAWTAGLCSLVPVLAPGLNLRTLPLGIKFETIIAFSRRKCGNPCMGSADRVPSSLKAIPRADGKLRPLARQSSMMFRDGVGSAASPVASSAAQERVRMMASANVCSRCDGCSIVGIHDHFRGLTFVAVNTITHESQDQLHRFLEGLQPKHSSQVEPGGFGLRRCGKQISTGA